jgi:hypothetical protein
MELKGVLLIGAANVGFFGAFCLIAGLITIPLGIALGYASWKWLILGIRALRGNKVHTGRHAHVEAKEVEEAEEPSEA